MPSPRPPMGWNSFDCFGASVTEAEVLENADFLAEHLLPFGWDHVVVDYCWSHPCPPPCTNPNQIHENQPYLAMDADFRLLPAPERFPSATGGNGFRPLADRIHAKGLKFGIHIMRGFPRQALYPGYPAATQGYRPAQIADPSSFCPWLNHMVGTRDDSPDSQRYYDHLFELYASWGVDFVKVDDITFPYRASEIEAVHRARERCGRPITLSLSPGPADLARADHVAAHAEMWRIGADFWDDWAKLRETFDLARSWSHLPRRDRWPDADMLPIGRLSKRGPVGPEHDSFFTLEEQRTMITLWAIFRSPLFIGGHLPETSTDTLALLTNRDVLAVHRDGVGGKPVRHDHAASVWVAQGPDNTAFIAAFNLDDQPRRVAIEWPGVLPSAPDSLRDLWGGRELDPAPDSLAPTIPAHGCALYRASLSCSRVPSRPLPARH